MSLFRCSQCGCVEDTALCHYWAARVNEMPPVCSACDPKIRKWHGEFQRQSAKDWTADERGFLIWSKGDVERWLGLPMEIEAMTAKITQWRAARTDGDQARAADE